MTFTKEKLAELERAMSDFVTEPPKNHIISGFSDRLSYRRDYFNAIYEAATALPHYITALAEAERVLDLIARDYIELSHDKVRVQRDDYMRYAKEALTTIRQLARGKDA